jgi:hypothetical protein
LKTRALLNGLGCTDERLGVIFLKSRNEVRPSYFNPHQTLSLPKLGYFTYLAYRTLGKPNLFWCILGRALPDITSGPEVRQIFKIRTVRKPDVFLPVNLTFNTFKDTKKIQKFFFSKNFSLRLSLFIFKYIANLVLLKPNYGRQGRLSREPVKAGGHRRWSREAVMGGGHGMVMGGSHRRRSQEAVTIGGHGRQSREAVTGDGQ